MLTSTGQYLAKSPSAEARASKTTGGEYGRMPTSLVAPTLRDPHLSPAAIALIAYRSLHADQNRPWGCSASMMRRALRKGFGRKIFQRAVREATTSGYLVRRWGTLKRPNADGRGRGFAVDCLTFGHLEHGYTIVDRHLFDGQLTPSEVTIALFLRARNIHPTMPWQIGKRLGRRRDNGGLVKASRGTVNVVMKALSSRGIATNYGTRESPLWAHATVHNVTLKKTTRLRATSRVRQISPARHKLNNHKGASPRPFGERTRRTDLAPGNAGALTAVAALPESVGGLAMQVPGDRLPFSNSVLRECHLLDVDLDALIDRYFEAEGKIAAKRKRIADPSAYLLKMARDERAKANGVNVDDLKDIASPNEWARGTALAKAMGAPTTSLRASRLCWPGDAELKPSTRSWNVTGSAY